LLRNPLALEQVSFLEFPTSPFASDVRCAASIWRATLSFPCLVDSAYELPLPDELVPVTCLSCLACRSTRFALPLDFVCCFARLFAPLSCQYFSAYRRRAYVTQGPDSQNFGFATLQEIGGLDMLLHRTAKRPQSRRKRRINFQVFCDECYASCINRRVDLRSRSAIFRFSCAAALSSRPRSDHIVDIRTISWSPQGKRAGDPSETTRSLDRWKSCFSSRLPSRDQLSTRQRLFPKILRVS